MNGVVKRQTTYRAEPRYLLKNVPLPLCTSQIPHGPPTDRPGLKIRSENDYEAGSGLIQYGGTTSALTRRQGETAEIRFGYHGNKVS